jgi:hypothetical protein
MAGKRKRCVRLFPTFCRRKPLKQRPPSPFCMGWGMGLEIPCEINPSFALAPARREQAQEKHSLLQLPLQQFDLFGERSILGDQGLDLAHGMQHRGVVASTEAAADFR